MTYFYWLTADNNQHIPITNGDDKCISVPFYLLQPNGLPPVKMSGISEECDDLVEMAYAWLSKVNLGVENPEWGSILYHYVSVTTYNGIYYYCNKHISDKLIATLKGMMKSAGEIARFIGVDDYEQEIAIVSPSGHKITTALNRMWFLDDAVKVPVSSLLSDYNPLKFSYSSSAEYERLPASCDMDGF